MRDVFIFAGQSNAQNRIPISTMAPLSGVPGFAKTAINQWVGDCPASVDTGVQYPAPTLANSPCKYNENAAGNFATYHSGFGSYLGQYPSGAGGSLTNAANAGWHTVFLQKYLGVNPLIGAIQIAIGGTALRGTWLPREYRIGAVAGATTTALTLDASDPNQFLGPSSFIGLTIQVLTGAQAGSVQTVTGYNSGTRTVTVSPGWATPPSAGDGYGVDQAGFQGLRTMISDAASNLDASDGPGAWRWAGFFWYQGESGAHANFSNDSQYLADARGMFAAVRGLTSAGLPVVVGRIGNNWGWSGGEAGDTTGANSYLKQLGYPYAAPVGSYQSTHSVTVDGRVDPATYGTSTIWGYINGANARRATQVTLGGDANCAWWSNDDLPTLNPFYKKWADNWSINVAALAPGDATYGEDWYGYHNGPEGQMAAGERAFAAFAAKFIPGRRTRLRAGGARTKLRTQGVRL